MIITKKRIRSLGALTRLIKNGSKFVIGVKNPERFSGILANIGFTASLGAGETILPANLGPVSSFNAEGKYVKHKDQPKETAYRTVEWHWKEWHGRYDYVERSKFVDVPYKRYHRTFVQPPSVEFTVFKINDSNIIASGPVVYMETNKEKVIHIINLYLEIFGECQFFTEELNDIINLPIRKINWQILPPGELPWQELKESIGYLVKAAPEGNQSFHEFRLETINSYKPDFAAVGRGGFQGYIVLGFNSKKLFVFESLYYGNATYIFKNDWVDLSQKTKAEILDQNLQDDRIIHASSWKKDIGKWLVK